MYKNEEDLNPCAWKCWKNGWLKFSRFPYLIVVLDKTQTFVSFIIIFLPSACDANIIQNRKIFALNLLWSLATLQGVYVKFLCEQRVWFVPVCHALRSMFLHEHIFLFTRNFYLPEHENGFSWNVILCQVLYGSTCLFFMWTWPLKVYLRGEKFYERR